MLPTNVSVIALIRFPSFTYKILPTYSPDPFGVFIAREILRPDKMARKDLKNEICCICLISVFHLSASKLQLASIRKITNTAFHACSPKREVFIC